MIDTAASHIRPPPYLAVTSGPLSHSPPPIWFPIITIAGPIINDQWRQCRGSGSGSSPTSQVGRQVFGRSAAAPLAESASDSGASRADIACVSGYEHLDRGTRGL